MRRPLRWVALALLMPVATVAYAQAPVVRWDATFGGSDVDELTCLQATADGGFVLGGWSRSPPGGDKSEVSRGSNDYWLVRLDALGRKRWDRTLGGSGSDQLSDLHQTADGGYFVAGTSGSPLSGDKFYSHGGGTDYWTLRLDTAGRKRAEWGYGGGGNYSFGRLLPIPNGDYLLSGFVARRGPGPPTMPQTEGWVFRIGPNGQWQWGGLYGGDTDDYPASQCLTAAGFLVGMTSESPPSGHKTEPSRGGNDYWVLQLGPTGLKRWDRTYGGSGNDELRTVLATPDGGLLLAGTSDSPVSGDKTAPGLGGSDFWVVRLDSLGRHLWNRTYGGSGTERLADALLTPGGGILLAGTSSSPVSGHKTQAGPGGKDYWLIQLDAAGQPQWDLTLGSAANEELRRICPTPDGGLLVGGVAASGPPSGHKTQPGRGNSDFWVVRLAPASHPLALAAPVALRFSPNPTRRSLTLHLPPEAPRRGLHLQLLDAAGRLVAAQALTPTGSTVSVSLPPQPPGLYLLRLLGPGSYHSTGRLQLE